VNSSAYTAKSASLKAKKLEAKGKRNWRITLRTTKDVKGGCDMCWHINSEFLWHVKLDSYTHAVLNLIILCTSFLPPWEN